MIIATDKRGIHVIFFLLLDAQICCWYSLEAPQWGASNEYPQHMFLLRNKRNIDTFWKKNNTLSCPMILCFWWNKYLIKKNEPQQLLQLSLAPAKALLMNNQKVLIFSLFLHKNSSFSYSLEASCQGTSNEYQQMYVFMEKYEKYIWLPLLIWSNEYRKLLLPILQIYKARKDILNLLVMCRYLFLIKKCPNWKLTQQKLGFPNYKTVPFPNLFWSYKVFLNEAIPYLL